MPVPRRSLLAALTAAAVAGVVYVRWALPRTAASTASAAEALLPIAGFVEEPGALYATHALTIRAPAAVVWAWLTQIGRPGNGFSRASWLERRAGMGRTRGEAPTPDALPLTVGDPAWLHPQRAPRTVLAVERERSLVLSEGVAFLLWPLDAGSTRVLVRERTEAEAGAGAVGEVFLGQWFFAPAAAIGLRLLEGLKERAERTARPPAPGAA